MFGVLMWLSLLPATDAQNSFRQTDMRLLYDHLFDGYQKELRPVINEVGR